MVKFARTVTKSVKAKDKDVEKAILDELATGPVRLDHLLDRLRRQGHVERQVQKDVYRLTRIGVLQRNGLEYGLAGNTAHSGADHPQQPTPDTAPSGKPLTDLIAEVGRPPSPERIQQRLARKNPRRFADAMKEHERLVHEDRGRVPEAPRGGENPARAESMDEKRWRLLALAEEDLRKEQETRGVQAAIGLNGMLTLTVNGQTAELTEAEARKLKKLLQAMD